MNYNFINTGKVNLNECASRLDKMRNLIERIENNPYGRLLEEGAKKRVQVSKENFLDLLYQSQDYNSDNGQFASVTYVKSAYDDVRKLRKGWDEDAVGQALSDTQDRAGEEWHKGLTSFQNGELKKNPVTQIIVAQRYVFHWLNENAYETKSQKWMDATDDNRLAHGLPLKFRNPTVSHRKSEAAPGTVHIETANTNGQNGNVALRFNMAGVIPSTKAYLVDADGKIVCEIPGNVYKAIKRPHYDGPEKEAIETLKDNPELLQSYADAKKKIDSEFQGRPLKSEQILCMAMSIGGTSYYFINPAINVEVTKGGATVDPDEWRSIAEELIDETFEPIESTAFSTDRIR